ncbi:MAG: hypothetical protein AB7N76_24825 [Planctomycetota bacterium]
MRRRDLVVLLGMGLVGGLLVPVVLHAQGRRASTTKCANNLRQLALATIEYADDKRFLPHVTSTRALDGGIDSADTPRKVRALVWYGDHDTPALLICPDSDDQALRIDAATKENMRRWAWGRAKADEAASPWSAAEQPAHDKLRELSYAMTRRGYNRNVSSSKLLAADRAVRDGNTTGVLAGDHDDGWNVVKMDASVEWVGYSAEAATQLASVEKDGGFLAVRPQPDAGAFAPLSQAPPAVTGWAGYYAKDDTVVDIRGEAWDRRARTWGVRGSVRLGQAECGLVGRDDGRGTFAATLDSGDATVRATSDGEVLTLAITQRGLAPEALRLPRAKRPPAPPTEQACREAAGAFCLALRLGNEEAARAWLVPGSRGASLDLLRTRTQQDQQLRELMQELAQKVVRGPDGGPRIDLSR